MFGFAPTKVSLYKAWADEEDSSLLKVEEIQTKGSCVKRLVDFGINGDDNIKLFVQHNSDNKFMMQQKTEINNAMLKLMKCRSISKDNSCNYNPIEEENMDHFFDNLKDGKISKLIAPLIVDSDKKYS